MAEQTTTSIVVVVPGSLGLTRAEADRLEKKWEKDLVNAVAGDNAKWHFKIHIGIEISND